MTKGFRLLKIIISGGFSGIMDNDKERKKKKGRRVLKRKGKKPKDECVEEVTSLVKDLKVEPLDSSLGFPEITVAETQSQPQSRRGSTNTQAVPVQFLLNPKEVARRASAVSALLVENKEEEEQRGEGNRRRDSITRRGSVKRGSLTWQEKEELETKRLKAAIEAMGMMKKAQKDFTWDSVKPVSKVPDVKVKRIPDKMAAAMSKDKALTVLGLGQGKGQKKPKKITDYSEEEILGAFQQECQTLTMEGRSSDLQNCHEAYQVLLKVLRAKNNFMKKAVAKREKQIKIIGQVEKASSIWRRRSSLITKEN